MLKPTNNTLTKEQFSKLREAKQVIKRQFGVEFSLQSDRLVRDVYEFALRSETNELFQIFIELNDISAEPVEQPLNEEQFIQLRLAKTLIRTEFAEELPLAEPDVLDSLYEYALNSAEEDLFDIYLYLYSRPDRPPQSNAPIVTGTRFRRLREAKHLAEAERDQAIPLRANTLTETLRALAAATQSAQLREILTWLNDQHENTLGVTGLDFAELSAADFERLREAKIGIYEEFGETLSLHEETAIDDLYRFALRSRDVELFDLFCDLLGPQMAARPDTEASRMWLSKEQFMLLRAAREAIQAEFDVMLVLQSSTLQDDLYQFALRAEEEELFDVCSAFQQLCEPTADESALPSKEEFRMLRRARHLVEQEFSEELKLHSDVIESDLYKYAVNSEGDELFDLFMELMALRSDASGETPTNLSRLLSKEEFIELRGAKRLILTEFGEHLALEEPNVLDRLYSFALESESDALFDLHAKLNANAAQDVTSTAPEPSETAPQAPAEESEAAVNEPEPKTKKRFAALRSLWGRASAKQNHEVDTPTPLAAARPTAVESLQPDAGAPASDEKSEAAEAALHQSNFPDRLVKAMTDKGTLVRVHDVELSKPPTGGQKAGSRPSAKRTRKRRPPAAANTMPEQERVDSDMPSIGESGWYISTIDDRLRVSLGARLSVGAAGELMVAAPQDAQSLAVIEMVADKPVVFTQSEDLLINDQPVVEECALASGDKIAVAGSVLQVEYAE